MSQPLSVDRLSLYAELIRLNRPIGIFLLLWPGLWALWIATEGMPSLELLLIFSLGVFLTRSAGCVINDYADRNIDPYLTDAAGNVYRMDGSASAYAEWQYGGLSSPYVDVDPGKLARVAMAAHLWVVLLW